ncbi:MAG: alcohol dehydrogenase catalytic domain-containing protein [Solirubrobacterales bacterium]|nr:alcohol dehydrogenase catalytic domain-containing protein [Solirubrobacterales bacterium]MBV9535690.1 alcohol dehydrogenase catalytic domain-containing protein [Solirubrobacterales bacterium]
MKAVAFQAPRSVEVVERPAPELTQPDEALITVQCSGICGSDLHIFHGRVKIEPGFVIGHEFVGTVMQTGDAVLGVGPGDRVCGCFHTACGRCFFCRRGDYHKCDRSRTFGHGSLLGSLPGTQAEQAIIPHADLTVRRVPEGLADDVALFAGDVMGTGYHAVHEARLAPGDSVAILGMGPVGLSAVQVARAAGAEPVLAIDTVGERLDLARRFGAIPVHLTEEQPREVTKRLTGGRGVDAAIDAVGHGDALDLGIRLVRKAGTVVVLGVYAEPCQVHMGLVWLKALTLRAGPANVIAHLDRVLELLQSGFLDPRPLVTHHLPLDDAVEAYALYDRREALKIALKP